MMPRIRSAFKQDEATTEELRSLLIVRRECLDQATQMMNEGVPMPVSERWGWRARIKTLGRDRDDSLLASITVTCPEGKIRVLRNVRLVRERTLHL